MGQRSASELEYHLLLARNLRYLESLDYARLEKDLIEVKRMLTGFIQKRKAAS